MKTAEKEKSKVLEGLNANQEKAVTFGAGPLLIIAGAGTGKTTVLTRRIMWLIEQGLAKREEVTPEAYLKYAESLQLATDSPTKTKKKKKVVVEDENPIDTNEIQRIKEIANAYHTYQKMILDLGYLDYNDLITYTIKLF